MLTIEERQNSLRYVIELDHCYTTRALPEQTKAAEPLSEVQHTDVNKNASPAPAARGAAETQSKTRTSNLRTPVSKKRNYSTNFFFCKNMFLQFFFCRQNRREDHVRVHFRHHQPKVRKKKQNIIF